MNRQTYRIGALLALAALWLGGCGNILSSPRNRDADAAVLTVNLTAVNAGIEAARTLIPADLDGQYYQLRFTPLEAGKEAVDAEAYTSRFIVKLPAGTWNINARGWHSKDDAASLPETPVLRGAGQVTVKTAEVLNARIVMYPLETGEGTLGYAIRFPGDTVSAFLRVYALPGIPAAEAEEEAETESADTDAATGASQQTDAVTGATTAGQSAAVTTLAAEPEEPDPVPVALVDLLQGATREADGTLLKSGSLNLGSGFYRIALDLAKDGPGGEAPSLLRKSEIAHIYDGRETPAAYTIRADQFTPGKVFTTAADLKTWLAAQPENTADAPYMAMVSGLDLSGSDTADLFDALSRYVALDLRGSTGGEARKFAASTETGGRARGQYLVSLVLPDAIETIGNAAFLGCSSLHYLKLPGQLKAIGESAFRGCPFPSITLPAGLNAIGEGAFANCTGLREADLSFLTLTSLGTRAFQSCTALESAKLPTSGLPDKRLPAAVFGGCTALTAVSLSPGLEIIGGFTGCTALSSLELPLSLKTIEASAFSGTALTPDLSLLVNLETLGAQAFRDCTALRTVSFPASLNTIGNAAFQGCINLSLAEIPESLADQIDRETFFVCRLVQFKIGSAAPSPALIRTIDGLKTLVTMPSATGDLILPEGIQKIADLCFYNSSSLGKITLPDSLIEIGMFAFSACRGLTLDALPPNLKTLGREAFGGCYSLTRLDLPGSIESIGMGAFLTTPLDTLIVRTNTPPGAANIFYAYTSEMILQLNIYVPDDKVAVYKAADGWKAAADRIKPISQLPTS